MHSSDLTAAFPRYATFNHCNHMCQLLMAETDLHRWFHYGGEHAGPAELAGTLGKPVLPSVAFQIVHELIGGRLADVDIAPLPSMIVWSPRIRGNSEVRVMVAPVSMLSKEMVVPGFALAYMIAARRVPVLPSSALEVTMYVSGDIERLSPV